MIPLNQLLTFKKKKLNHNPKTNERNSHISNVWYFSYFLL